MLPENLVISYPYDWNSGVKLHQSRFAGQNAFSGRRPMLTVIDSLHWLGCLLIIGAIVGGLGR